LEPVYLFALADEHARWATVRQAIITGNIANANTPGYVALDVEPFSAVLDETVGSTMARTVPAHFSTSGAAGDGTARDWGVKETDTPVALDQQLMLADETNRAFALDNAIMRAFHRMLMASVRSGQ
jgi:flagellar basal-body rod protein FlgB